MPIVLIAFFAFFGGILRYGLSFVPVIGAGFPIGTLLANYLGCFLLMGLVRGVLLDRKAHPTLILGLATGFCGGLTTFSSFALDTVRLTISHHYLLAVSYLIASMLGGLFCAWLGDWCAQFIKRRSDVRCR